MPMFDIERSDKVDLGQNKTEQETLLRARDVGEINAYGNDAGKAPPIKLTITAKILSWLSENIIKTTIGAVVTTVTVWVFLKYFPIFA